CADDVSLSKRLKEKYPHEMTIVLQHRFWDLNVTEEGFDVKLTFDGIPERLVVPFSAIKVFFDPSVRYGLQFEDPESVTGDHDADLDGLGDGVGQSTNGEIVRARPELVRAPTRSNTAQPDEPAAASTESDAAATGADENKTSRNGQIEEERTVLDSEDVANATEGAQILRLDAFRKKTP
nr:hypothetical protein [Alphaproteobacteria bacterium]